MYTAFRVRLLFIISLIGADASHQYAQDKHQTQALGQIKKEIAALVLQKHATPIQTVLERYKIHSAANFSGKINTSDSLQISRFLPKSRPVNVSRSEWQALQKSDITLDQPENNSADFALIDLDEDGRRDLIVDCYTGGTGLFSYVYVYRQVSGRFISTNQVAASVESFGAALYSISGRGGDQKADWIRVNGRIYLAYRSGEYGKDQLLLMRVFSSRPKKLQGLAVEYNYQHTLARRQENYRETEGNGTTLLEAGFYRSLQKGLAQLNRTQRQSQEVESFAQCPVPPNLPPEKHELYASSWFGTGHYTFDIAADFPVFHENKCYAARLVSFKGSYPAAGRFMITSLWVLRSPDGEQEEYKVQTRRFAWGVKIVDIEYPFEN